MLTRTTTLLALILALASAALATTATQAAGSGDRARPPAATATPSTPIPLDGGTIYYFDIGSRNGPVHAMDPDGTNDTVVPGIDSEGGSKPSRMLHNGVRWYVTLREVDGVVGFFPGGPSDGRLWELDVVPEGGAPIPLTDNAGACINIWGGGPGVRFDWVPDAGGQADGAISWLGSRWVDTDNNGTCDQIVDGGVFRGEIDIDTSGNVSFTQPTQAEVDVPLGGMSTRAAEFAWAPDGRQLAYDDVNGSDLWVVDPAGNRSMIFNGRVSVFFPIDWSPDLNASSPGYQGRIAFTGAVSGPNGADTEIGTYTIAPDGTGRVRVASAKLQKKSSDPFEFHYFVHWSPSGNQLIYLHRSYYSNPTVVIERLYRVNANGTNNVLLVDSSGNFRPFPMGWEMD